MPIEEYEGIVINKMTLAQYKELKAAGSLVDSQTYVITDLDEYLKDEVFNTNDLSKTTFDTGTQNTDGSFMIQIFKDETYSTLYTTLELDFDELEKDMTFELPFTGWYLVRLGLNGDIIDDKLNVWKYFDRCAYSLNIKLVSNVLNHCEIENISITKTHKLPQRLASNSYYSTIYDNAIDEVETGFYIWATSDTDYQIISGDVYYYVFSNISCDDDTNERWGVQIAIAEASNLMYFRRLTDDQVWSQWKRVLNDTDANLYWQLRVGRVITAESEIIIHNQNTIDMSSLPINTILMTIETQNNQSFNYKIILEDGVYKFRIYLSDDSYYETLARGSLLSSMDFDLEYDSFTSSGVGTFAKITYIHEDLLSIIDNLMRINNCDF